MEKKEVQNDDNENSEEYVVKNNKMNDTSIIHNVSQYNNFSENVQTFYTILYDNISS